MIGVKPHGEEGRVCLSGKPIAITKGVRKLKVPPGFAEEPPDDVILAWRAWTLSSGLPIRLYSYNQKDFLWEPGKAVKSHTSVDSADNYVGVHAYKLRKDVLPGIGVNDKAARGIVLGQVMLGGKIAEHSNGYRAELAYPFRLWTNKGPAVQNQLREIYGCAVGREYIPRLLEIAA